MKQIEIFLHYIKTNILTKLILLSFFVYFLTFISCRNYYNDTIEWFGSIKKGTEISDVRRKQPEFMIIDWDKPDTIGKSVYYAVTKIQGSRDILNMKHFLVFRENKYSHRYSRK